MRRAVMVVGLVALVAELGVVSAAGKPVAAKDLCKGTDNTVSVVADDGVVVSATVWLEWNLLVGVPDPTVEDGFRNQGDCVAHVNHGGSTWASCGLLLEPAVQDSVVPRDRFDDLFLGVGCIYGLPRQTMWLGS